MSTLTELAPNISESIERTKYNIRKIRESPLQERFERVGRDPFLAFKDLYDENEKVDMVEEEGDDGWDGEGEEGEEEVDMAEKEDDDGWDGEWESEFPDYEYDEGEEEVDMAGIKLLLTENDVNKIMEKLSYEFVLSYILSDSIVTLGRGREDADKTHQTDFGKQDNTTTTLYRITLLTYKYSWKLLIDYIDSLKKEEKLDLNHCKEIYKYIALLTLSLGVPPEIYTDFLKWTKADDGADVFTKHLPLGNPTDNVSTWEEIKTIWGLISFLKNNSNWTLYIFKDKKPGVEEWEVAKEEFKQWLVNLDTDTFKFSSIKGNNNQFTKLIADKAHLLPQNINTVGRITAQYTGKIPGVAAATNMTQIQNFVLPQSRDVNQGKGGDEAFLESRRGGDQLVGLKILLEILQHNSIGHGEHSLDNFMGSIREEMSAETLQNLLSGIVYIFLDMLIDNIIEKKLTGSGPDAVRTILIRQQHLFEDVRVSNNTSIDEILVKLRNIYNMQAEEEKQKILESERIQSLQRAFDESISRIFKISESEKLDITTLYGKDNKIADCVLKGLQLLYEVKKDYQKSHKVIDVLVRPEGTATDKYDIGTIADPLKEACEQLRTLITNFDGNSEPPESVLFKTWAPEGEKFLDKAIKYHKSSDEEAVTLESIKDGFNNYIRREIFIIQMLKNTATIKTALDILKRARKGEVAGFDAKTATEIIEELAERKIPSIFMLKSLMKELRKIVNGAEDEDKLVTLGFEITKYNDIVDKNDEVKLGKRISFYYKKFNEAITSLKCDIAEIERALYAQDARQVRAAAARVNPSITVSTKEQPLLFYKFIQKIENFFQKLVSDKFNFSRKDWLDESSLKRFFNEQINNLVYRNYFELLTPEQIEVVSKYLRNYTIPEVAKAEDEMNGSIQLDKEYFNTLQREIAKVSGNRNFESIKDNFRAITFQYLMLLAYVEVAVMTMTERIELTRHAREIWNKYANQVVVVSDAVDVSDDGPESVLGKRLRYGGPLPGAAPDPSRRRLGLPDELKRGYSNQWGGGRNYKKLKKNTKKIKLNKKTKKIKQKDFKNNKKKTKKRKNTKTKKPTKNLTLKKRRPTKIRKPTKTRNPKKKPTKNLTLKKRKPTKTRNPKKKQTKRRR